MHTEHLQNVRIGRVAGGWLVAIAVTSLVMLVVTSLGFADTDISPWWSLLPLAIGFLVGGMFCGMRALQAPVLHGISMGLMSLAVWLIVSVLAYALKGGSEGHTYIVSSLTPSLTVAVMFVQIASAIIGALMGYNIALRGKPGLSE